MERIAESFTTDFSLFHTFLDGLTRDVKQPTALSESSFALFYCSVSAVAPFEVIVWVFCCYQVSQGQSRTKSLQDMLSTGVIEVYMSIVAFLLTIY